MWPFNKKPKVTKMSPNEISFSQADITERFDDNMNLKPDDWIETTPLNLSTQSPESSGLPPINASDDEIYAIAKNLSSIRESINIPSDGVYCPVCHIANIKIEKLHTPCPKCKRQLLKFGWD